MKRLLAMLALLPLAVVLSSCDTPHLLSVVEGASCSPDDEWQTVEVTAWNEREGWWADEGGDQYARVTAATGWDSADLPRVLGPDTDGSPGGESYPDGDAIGVAFLFPGDESGFVDLTITFDWSTSPTGPWSDERTMGTREFYNGCPPPP